MDHHALPHAPTEILARHRDWAAVSKQLVAACQNPEFARLAYCSWPVALGGGATLSVRFMELAQQLMGNVAVETEPLSEDATSIRYRMTVTDLESHAPLSEIFRVEKIAGSRRGRQEMARVKRELLSSLVPPEICGQCLAQCREVVRREDGKALGVVTKEVLTALGALGVGHGALKEYLGHSPASLEVAKVEELRSVAALIRDGEITWSEVLTAVRAGHVASETRRESPPPKKGERKPKPKAPRATRGTQTEAAPPPAAPPKAPPAIRRDEEDPPARAGAAVNPVAGSGLLGSQEAS